MSGALPAGGVEPQVAAARERLKRARNGDWHPFEQHLRDLGASYAKRGLAFSAWYGIAKCFYETIATRAVDRHAAEPARLAEVLWVLGDYMERSLAIIGAEYLAVKERLAHDAEARHTEVLDAALDAVIEIDDRGVITEFNRAAEQTFGYAKADAIGQPLATLVIPARFRDRHCTAVARLLATGEGRLLRKRVELHALRADGSEFPMELALVAVTNADGRRRLTGFLRDLTEQHRTEESLAVRAHALEQAQFGIVVSDPITRTINNVNPAYSKMTGYDAEELIGASGEELIAPASHATVPEVRRTLQERGHHTYELGLLRKDGTILPVLASSSTVETRAGATMRVSTVIDISERNQLEQARAAAAAAREHAAARLEILSTTAHEFASASGDVRSLLDLVARRLGEIIGEGCVVRLLSEDRNWLEPTASVYHADPARLEIARRILGAQRTRVGDGITGHVAATGVAVLIPELAPQQRLTVMPAAFLPLAETSAIASLLAIPLRSRDRTVGAIVLVRSSPGQPYTIDDQHFAQDLADRAGLAIDNATLVATLEQRVAERTAKLEAVNHELEAFSYSASHDLRTPLRAIDGFSRMLASDHADRLDESSRHYLDRIRAGSQRMSHLIDDLLALARIGRASLTVARIDLSALACEVIEEIQHREPARDVTLHVAPGMIATADARLLRILFENLLGNAWKFTAKRERATIWVGAHIGAFHVRDAGAGFDMAYADKLFVPFQRLHASGEYEGSGVGLATVHRIVTRHGGRIWAEAELGKGATFFFTLGDGHE